MKRLPWFRLWHEARNDRKLATLTDAEHRVWFHLLCMAAESSDRGEVDISDMDLLAVEVSGGDVELAQETLDHLVKLKIGIVEDALFVFLHWLERQYDKESDWPGNTRNRQRRHREKSRDVTPEEGDVTPNHADVTPCHAPSRDVTPCHALEEKRREESREETSPPTPLAGGVAPADSDSQGSRTLYPADFEAFWAIYPRKIGKGAALKAWNRIRGRPPVADLIAAVEAVSRSAQWQRDGGQYVPHPSVWLNQRRWEDEPETETPGPAEAAREAYRAEMAENWRLFVESKRKEIGRRLDWIAQNPDNPGVARMREIIAELEAKIDDRNRPD